MVQSSKLTALKRTAARQGWAKWIRSEADERAVLAGCRFDIGRAEHPVEFFRTFLRHSKGGRFVGQPFELLDWQRDEVVMPLYGWLQKDEFGVWQRRYTRAYVEIPKKNGKSTLASGIGLYMLVGDGEPGAEVYSAATDRKQAGIVHGEAVNMVDASEELSAALGVHRSSFTISFPDTRSSYKALSAKPRHNEGWNAHCIVADELHKWYGDELFNALRWAFANRDQPLFFMITTAGDDPESVCWSQHEYAKGILDGINNDIHYLPYIRAAAADDDPMDEATWFKANPSLGVTVTVKSFRDDAEEAQQSNSDTAEWKRYRLNIWSTSTNPWLKDGKWAACRREFTAADLEGRPCYAGLDLAKTRDTCALVLVFGDDDDEEGFKLLPFFYLPEETAEELKHKISVMRWAEMGLVTLTPGDVADYEFIKADIVGRFDQAGNKTWPGLIDRFDLRELAYDPYNAEQFTQQLQEDHGIERFAFKQTMPNMAEPTKEFERRVLAGKAHHNGHAVMDWQIGNANVFTDHNGNERLVKPKKNDHRKIDGPVAAVMAFSRWLNGDGGGSFYDNNSTPVMF